MKQMAYSLRKCQGRTREMFQTYTKETQQKAVGRLAIQRTGGTTGKLERVLRTSS